MIANLMKSQAKPLEAISDISEENEPTKLQ